MTDKRLVLILKVIEPQKGTSIYEEAIDECDDEGALSETKPIRPIVTHETQWTTQST